MKKPKPAPIAAPTETAMKPRAAEADEFMSGLHASEANRYGVPPLRFVGNAVMLSEMTGLDRLKIPKWVRDEGLIAAKTVANGKGKATYGFDLKTVFDWWYQRGYQDGVREAEKKAAKAKGAAGGKTWTDPETGEKLPISGPEVQRAIDRHLIAKADKMEEEAIKARISREHEAKEISYNYDITAVFAYVMRQTAAAIASAESKFISMLVERKVHPDIARKEVNTRIRLMLEPLDKANPFRDQLAAEKAAARADDVADVPEAEDDEHA